MVDHLQLQRFDRFIASFYSADPQARTLSIRDRT
jgi:hypothetical protein